ncbi:MAG: RNA-directed DNA polymerase [Myxococcales bacterium]|nr:RNA-directed DNA polymerase [Myxococcales bacterium]
MSAKPNRRQELYDRIRNSSKDEVILEEMIRLGFWPRAGEIPADPGDEIRRRGELQRQLDELRRKASRLYNEASLIREARKQRLADARRKKQETRERRERERQERAAAWAARKQHEVVYLGEGVSSGLAEHTSDVGRLQAAGLPLFADPGALAQAMGVPLGELRFLAFHRRVATLTHYRRFQIAKKSGGTRLISAPMPRLKRAQAWVLRNVLDKVALHEAAHGFRGGRSIVSNAAPHVGADVVINLDVENFFPTITLPRVKGVFRALGYSEAIATILALLCTEPETTEVELDGRTYYVGLGDRVLPQGSPASPAVTNALCRRLDRRLDGLAEQLGFEYTRYADDLTFSRRGDIRSTEVGELLGKAADIVRHEGFRVHPDKTRVMRRGRQMEVTGVVVNDKLSVDRKTLRRFRAALFQVEKDGPAGKRWGDGPRLLASMHGYASFVTMVDRARGEPLLRRVQALIERYGVGASNASAAPGEGKAAAPTATGEAPSAAQTDAPEPEPTPPAPQPKKKKWRLW